MKKLFLTDITLHSKEQRATPSLDKAVQRKENGHPSPRFYAPHIQQQDIKIYPDGRFEIRFNLPPDIEEGIEKGEIELIVPKGGLPIFPGKDMIEKIAQLKEKERRELIHRSNRLPWWKKRRI